MRLLTVALLALIAVAGDCLAAEVTFNRDIAPLVWQHCAGCHRPGEVAPFSLLTYAEVSKRAEQIRDVTAQHIMPPWKPVAGHGEFANGRRLNDAELQTIRQWVAAGKPEGKAQDLPTPPTFVSGWQMGPPDLVVKMAEPISVASEGRDVYLNLLLPFAVPAGKYIKAVEYRPSNRRVVHHAVLFYDTSGKPRERDALDSAPGFEAVTPPGRHLPGTLAIWTPGRNPLPLPTGLSMPWPAQAELILQLHLHPSGKPETEQSSVGFYFTSDPPERTLLDMTLIDTKIDIPPGEKAYRTKDSCVLPIDMDARSIFPHMHMIGKQIKVTATLPDGSVKPLLWIDDWDFNWQDLYQYAEPVRLPKGTTVAMEAVHDNSAENPHNPKQPPQQVRWGEQTLNEMSIAFVNLTPAQESDLAQLGAKNERRIKAAIVPITTQALMPAKAPEKPLTPEDYARRASEALKKYDRDADEKLSVDEIVTAIGNRLPAAELERLLAPFDKDSDKALNASELAAAIKVLSPR